MQNSLFDAEETQLLPGLRYEAEERSLIGGIASLLLYPAKYKQFLARRRIVSFGSSYDFGANRLLPEREIDERAQTSVIVNR